MYKPVREASKFSEKKTLNMHMEEHKSSENELCKTLIQKF